MSALLGYCKSGLALESLEGNAFTEMLWGGHHPGGATSEKVKKEGLRQRTWYYPPFSKNKILRQVNYN